VTKPVRARSYATRCPILRLKCTEFDFRKFRWGFAPDPAGGA